MCGKTTKVGMDTTHKHGGQWAMRAPKSQKLWKPNLQVARVEVAGEGVRKLKFCIKCLRMVKSGDVKAFAEMKTVTAVDDKQAAKTEETVPLVSA